MKREGEAAVTMPDQLRLDALACAEKLQPYGKTISDATEHFLAFLAAMARSCTVAELVAEFIAAKKKDGASQRYLEDLSYRLATFEEKFGALKVAEILPAQIDDWLRGLDVAPLTRNNFRRILSVFFSFAKIRGYSTSNPVQSTAKAKVVCGTPGIFTPEQMRTVLETGPAWFVPFLAIGGFAGLRSAEIERLDWSKVDLAGRLIEVTAKNAKTAQRRFVPICDALAAWLAPHARASGPVAAADSIRFGRLATVKASGIEWPSNVLRHSFATYRLAQFRNAAQTAAELGHAGAAMLYQHYRELVTPDAAAKWWQIMPPADYGNIVAFHAEVANV
jgi:integrase